MKISNSKKQLARIISQNEGWREGAKFAAQGGNYGHVGFASDAPMRKGKVWDMTRGFAGKFLADEILPNWHQTILSRDEYFHLYPAPDADGWIEWKGGECPVEFGTLVDIKDADGTEWECAAAMDSIECRGDFWTHAIAGSGNNIAAYRLHKQERPHGIEPTSPFAPEPTIEQLAAEYRNRKDYADRKQQEADEAKAEAEAKLSELYQAGLDIGLDIAIASDEQEQDPELVITDWRDLQVGDEVEYLEGTLPDYVGLCGVVDSIDRGRLCGNYRIDVRFPDGATRWCSDWRFIRRP